MGETATTAVTTSYENQVRFTAPPGTVYDALSTTVGVSGWWMPATGSAAEGGELCLQFPPGPGAMRVEVAEPSSRVVWSVLTCDFLPDWVGTRIHFALRPGEDGGTVLDFHHEGLTRQLECFDQCRQGWDFYLASLRDHVDSGAGRPGNRHER
jgi:uncharacterized protein YndB with AHSA1/START domain